MHYRQTNLQHERLKQICQKLEISSNYNRLSSFTAMLENAEDSLRKCKVETDVVLLTKALVIEHQEMGEYLALGVMAKQLNLDDEIKNLLEQNKKKEEEMANYLRFL